MNAVQEICTCTTCRVLDRRHPAEGVQLRLIATEDPDGPVSMPARQATRPLQDAR